MNDINLWSLLHADNLDPDALIEPLTALAERPFGERAPFFGALLRCLEHDDHRLRAAAVRLLERAEGWLARKQIVRLLSDRSAPVRDAALDTLVAGATRAPESWLYALTHAEVSIRQRALTHLSADPKAPRFLRLYLLADEALNAQVRDLLEQDGVGPDDLRVLLTFVRSGQLPAQTAAQLILHLPWASRGGETLMRLFTDDIDYDDTFVAPEGLRALVEQTQTASGALNQLLSLFAAPELATERALLVEALIEAARRGALKEQPLQLLGLALLRQTLGWGLHEGALGLLDPTQLALVALTLPAVLLLDAIPVAVRRDAARQIARSRLNAWWGEDAAASLDADLCLQDGEPEKLDLEAVTGVLRLLGRNPYKTLLKRFQPNTLSASFNTDPAAAATVFSLPITSSTEPRDRRALLSVVLKHAAPCAELHAQIALALTADGLKDLNNLLSDAELAAVRPELLKRSAERQLTDAKRVALADMLAAIDTAGALMDLARAPEGPLRAELLTTLSGRIKPRQFGARMLELPTDAITAILALEAYSAALPYAHRRALVHTFIDSPEPALRAWAEEAATPNGDAAPILHRRDSDEVETLTEKEARRLSCCPENTLAGHLEVVYTARTRGVCEALLARPDAAPQARLEICLAALVSADPLHAIDQVFVRFGGQEAFMGRLRELIVARCTTLSGMSPFANAWLHAWEERLSDFGAWCVDTSGLDNTLEAALQLRSPQLATLLWCGVERLIGRWRWRSPSDVGDRCPPGLDDVLLGVLLGDRDPAHHPGLANPAAYARLRRLAASTLVNIYAADALPKRLGVLADAILPRLNEMDGELRDALNPWIDSRGVAHTRQGQEIFTRVTPQELESIRRCRVPRKLTGWCRSTSQQRVEEAAFQLMELGQVGFEHLTEAIVVNPPRVRLLIELTALWPQSAWLGLEQRLDDPTLPPRVAHLLGVASLTRDSLNPRAKANTWERIIAALCAPSDTSWVLHADWSALCDLHNNPMELTRRLATSPHHAIVHTAINTLVEADPHPATRRALRIFLEAGSERALSLRRSAARALLDNYTDSTGLPVLLAKLFESSGVSSDLLRAACAAEIDTVSRSAAMATLAYRPQYETMLLLNHSSVPARLGTPGLLGLLHASNNPGVQSKVLEHLRARPETQWSRQKKIRLLARCFAWGVRRGRELTGALFRVSMVTGNALGYTRLESRSIHVNPLPMMRGERGGEQVVKALMLHEFGHHMYHADPKAMALWDRAGKERLHGLLNLVADEHLERNLRARNSDDGDALKQLAAYAFQHARHEVKAFELLDMLGFRALRVLRDVELTPSRTPGKVEVSVGRVLQRLEGAGSSFSRFFRALRMGLGNRHRDPKVAEALNLFKSRFRHSDMERLYAITLELRRIFEDEIQLLDLVSPERCNSANVGETMIHTDGVTSEELDRAIRDELSASPSGSTDAKGSSQTINLSEEESFARIQVVKPVGYDRASHKVLARKVARPARAMREVLCRLGLSYVQQRRRLQGRQLDRGRLRSAVLRGDPRMLIARQLREQSDLFLGIVVDCSGSMRSGQRIERARLFATLIAEATVGLKGVDTHVIGFTDQVIYDAGDARRCAAHALEAGGGNNDAAALFHMAQLAKRSQRSAKLLVMISDGSPTECSVDALKGLVVRLGRQQICCAQVAVQKLQHVCFPHYIEVLDANIEASVTRFGQIVTRLVRRTLKG